MLRVNGVEIEDTFAEAFPMSAARRDRHGRDRRLGANGGRRSRPATRRRSSAATPRPASSGALPPRRRRTAGPGVSLLLFAFSRDARQGPGQPRRPVRADLPDDGLLQRPRPGEETVKVGGLLRFFGDGCQISKKLDGRRYWRIPVMDGEFLCEDTFGMQRAWPAATS